MPFNQLKEINLEFADDVSVNWRHRYDESSESSRDIGSPIACSSDDFDEVAASFALLDDIPQVCGVKRGRPRKYDVPRIPRMLKSDIRRHYATMLTNVMNTCDQQNFQNFFRNYATEDMIVTMNTLDEARLQLSLSEALLPTFALTRPDVRFQWQDWVQLYLTMVNSFSVDRIVRASSSQVVTRSDSRRSTIVVEVEKRFTVVHAIDVVNLLNDMLEFRRLQDNQSNSSFSPLGSMALTFLPDPFDFYLQRTGRPIPLMDKPKSISFKTRIILRLTESKHIERIEVESGPLNRRG